MIVGQNSLVNQSVPTFRLTNLVDGQIIKYDSTVKSFVNANLILAGTTTSSLGQLLNVANSVDNVSSLQNGHVLSYNSISSTWENKFVNYATILNTPNNSSYSFTGLSDTLSSPLAKGYVKWNSTGTQLVYSTAIPISDITGLAVVATTGDFNDLLNKPAAVVSSVSVASANGVSGTTSVSAGTSVITLSLGAITPSSVASSGAVTGSNLSGTNTGDNTANSTYANDYRLANFVAGTNYLAPSGSAASLTGFPILNQDTTGSAAKLTTPRSISVSGDGVWTVSFDGTANTTSTLALATVNSTVGTFGSASQGAIVTVNAKGLVTNATSTPILASGSLAISAATFNDTLVASGSVVHNIVTTVKESMILKLKIAFVTPGLINVVIKVGSEVQQSFDSINTDVISRIPIFISDIGLTTITVTNGSLSASVQYTLTYNWGEFR